MRKEKQSDLSGHQAVAFAIWILWINLVHHDKLRVETAPSLILRREVSFKKFAGGENRAKFCLFDVLVLALMVYELKALLDLFAGDEVNV